MLSTYPPARRSIAFIRLLVATLMMSGNGGQKVIIVLSLDLISVFTGGIYNVESSADVMMAERLLPAPLSSK